MQFPGVRSFVPGNGVIVKSAFPSLTVGAGYLMITTLGTPWKVLLADNPELVIDQ